jgi:hypothetical protein
VHSKLAKLALRGLFWLSRILDPTKRLRAVVELYTIRNLEHTYLKVHEMLAPRGARHINDALRTPFNGRICIARYTGCCGWHAQNDLSSPAMHHEERSDLRWRMDVALCISIAGETNGSYDDCDSAICACLTYFMSVCAAMHRVLPRQAICQ